MGRGTEGQEDQDKQTIYSLYTFLFFLYFFVPFNTFYALKFLTMCTNYLFIYTKSILKERKIYKETHFTNGNCLGRQR